MTEPQFRFKAGDRVARYPGSGPCMVMGPAVINPPYSDGAKHGADRDGWYYPVVAFKAGGWGSTHEEAYWWPADRLYGSEELAHIARQDFFRSVGELADRYDREMRFAEQFAVGS